MKIRTERMYLRCDKLGPDAIAIVGYTDITMMTDDTATNPISPIEIKTLIYSGHGSNLANTQRAETCAIQDIRTGSLDCEMEEDVSLSIRKR